MLAARLMNYADSETCRVEYAEIDHATISVLERDGMRSIVVRRTIEFPRPLSTREWVSRTAYTRVSPTEHFFGCCDAEHWRAPQHEDFVRASTVCAFRVVQVTQDESKLITTAKFSLGGNIPKAVNNTFAIPAILAAPVSNARYALCVRKAAEMVAGGADARALGQLLVMDTGAANQSVRATEAPLARAPH